MPHPFSIALKVVWGLFIIYWLWSARKIKLSSKMESIPKRFLLYWLPVLVAVFLIGPGDWFGRTWLREQFVPHSYFVETIGLLIVILGGIIAVWARYLLGRNWSLVVQVKEDHELIKNGPYGIVRHPIYSGLLTMFLGNAIMVGDWRGLIAVAILFISFYFKLKKEEIWLGEYFGEQYKQYKEHTRMIIPGIL